VTPARLRPAAETDLIERTRYYREQASADVAARFFDAAIDTLKAIERMPGTGTARVADLASVAGLRLRRIEGFGCGWFYFVRANHLDIVRLLADAQDLAAILHDLSDDE
jgi:toxin ParE1/3/4